MEDELDIQIDGLPFKMRPLPAYPIFRKLPQTDPIHTGRKVLLYKWDCALRRGVPRRVPRRIPILPLFNWRDLTERNPAQSKLKSKAKLAEFLLAFDIAPSTLEGELHKIFSPSFRNIDWPALVNPLRPRFSFEVYVTIQYAYFVTRPNFTQAQLAKPLIRNVANKYFLIGLPVSHTITVKYTGTCPAGGVLPPDKTDTIAVPGDQTYRNLLMWHGAHWMMQMLSPIPWGWIFGLEDGPSGTDAESAEPVRNEHGSVQPGETDSSYAGLGQPASPEETLAAIEPQPLPETLDAMFEYDDAEKLLGPLEDPGDPAAEET